MIDNNNEEQVFQFENDLYQATITVFRGQVALDLNTVDEGTRTLRESPYARENRLPRDVGFALATAWEESCHET